MTNKEKHQLLQNLGLWEWVVDSYIPLEDLEITLVPYENWVLAQSLDYLEQNMSAEDFSDLVETVYSFLLHAREARNGH